MINVVQVGYGYWGTNVARNLMAAKMQICMPSAIHGRSAWTKPVRFIWI